MMSYPTLKHTNLRFNYTSPKQSWALMIPSIFWNSSGVGAEDCSFRLPIHQTQSCADTSGKCQKIRQERIQIHTGSQHPKEHSQQICWVMCDLHGSWMLTKRKTWHSTAPKVLFRHLWTIAALTDASKVHLKRTTKIGYQIAWIAW